MSLPRIASGTEVDVELVGLVEIDADERIATLVTFDLDDIDAAIAELDARYLADEAAHAPIWSVIAQATPRSIVTSCHRRRRIGCKSTTGYAIRSRRLIRPRTSVPRGISCRPQDICRDSASVEQPRSSRYPSRVWTVAGRI